MVMNGSPIIVIQCAARKRSHAGRLRLCSGREVLFVANPANAPLETGYVSTRDEQTVEGTTGRQCFVSTLGRH